jgi:predicted acetyltransferase
MKLSPAATDLQQRVRGKLGSMSSRVELIKAGPEHQRSLENLLELYIHDFSEFVPLDVSEDGRFGYPDLSLYWSEPSRMAFLARIEGKLAGFALITRGPGLRRNCEVWDMVEFFVMRRYRYRGIGVDLAGKIWRLCPGAWQIRVRSNNLPAQRFWNSAISAFTKGPVSLQDLEIEDVAWNLFSFDSCGACSD